MSLPTPFYDRDGITLYHGEALNLQVRTEMAVGAIRGEALTHAMQENNRATDSE